MSALERLRDELGDIVDTTAATLEAARADRSGQRSAGRPLAVVHARTADDVQRTLRIASATGTSVVVRGAGTGLAGAANAGPGQIVLSTAHMDRLLEVRADDLLAVVEPGILNARLNTLLAEHGVWWAPDPASRDISTVGGNIATGAGGLLCAKYGVVRDAVLGLDLVLADGRMLHLGHRTVKGVTGLDLTSLAIGSEGRLGVIVGATLKLRRLVEGAGCTIAASFASVREAAVASAAVTAAGVQPAIMELMDAGSLAAVHDLLDLPAPAAGTAQLTIQTDGPAARDEAERIATVLTASGGTVRMTQDPAEGERLLAIRRSMHPAMAALGTTLIEDVAVPRSAMPAMFDEIARIEREYGIRIPTVAHAGDGNLHPNFIFDGEQVPDAIWDAAGALFRAAIRLGGTLTGEHGIGTLKSRWLAEELGDDQWQLQRDIVRVFDPQGILNPGKVFADA
ncbi:FAD-linked oxidase C-terminal domain-containing protein [Microbacterium sp. ARD32]|uniref:FAD-binding oxidoreductase n=1 Tax=Microbacterium sp. ARD32 TaxID=2962577 RepID=UPI002880FC3A|nr:FAD-linked oxidase C-terminal domain-containing protein [Microbacterium sp. ARD32]MDT0156499.1 FAD-linked oxidase C-terminal domain-containing protein [Microbacterium sp. ARD32]